MSQFTDNIGMQAAGGILGMITGGQQDKRNYDMANRVGRLNNILGMEMGNYNFQKQLEMWERTGPVGQMEQLKKAGLNPALMYGKSGPGGMLAAPGTAGHASANTGDYTREMGMGMQLATGLQQAQIENLKADTEKKKAEATKTAGADTDLTTATTEMQRIQNEIAEKTKDKTIEGISYQVAKTWKESSILAAEDLVAWDENVINARIKGTAAGYLQAILQNKQLEAQIKLTDEQAKAVTAAVIQKWTELGQGNIKLAIEAFKAEVEAAKPGLWNVLGGLAQDAVTETYELLGIKPKAKRAK